MRRVLQINIMSTSKGKSKAPAIHLYKDNELDLSNLSELAEKKFGKKPFQWQLEAAATVLKGEDLILDVGTGSGKSLVFTLPLVLDPTDVSITVSPLSALMIDQVRQETWDSERD